VVKDLNISLLLDYYGEMLTDKQREMISHYFNDDLSLAEIAQNEGITRQGVRDAIKRSEMLLAEMEEKLGFLQKASAQRTAAEQIRESFREIDVYNLRYGGSREIGERARAIYELAGELLA